MEFKRLVLFIVIGAFGGMVFVTLSTMTKKDDKILRANLSSLERNLSPLPTMTKKLSSLTPTPTMTKISSTMTKNNVKDDKKVPEPTPRATKAPIAVKTTTPTPKPTSTPIITTPTPTPTPKPTPTPTVTPEITPTPSPTPEPTVEPEPDTVKIVINELAWMGTGVSANDEWIELYNAGTSVIDLEGWILAATDQSPTIALSGVIEAKSYFLLERTDDSTVSDITADTIYTGALVDSCEVLGLYNNNGDLVDNVGCYEDGWFAGEKDGDYSMERISPDLNGLDNSAWKSNNSIRNGLDADGVEINGTPRNPNS